MCLIVNIVYSSVFVYFLNMWKVTYMFVFLYKDNYLMYGNYV